MHQSLFELKNRKIFWGGGHPLPTPYSPQRLWRLDARAYGARPRPQGRLPKIRANLVLPPK